MSKRLERLKKYKINKMRQKKSIKMPVSVFYVGALLLSIEPDLKCGLYTQGDSTGENQLFPCKQLLIGHSFLVIKGEFISSSPPSAGTQAVLNLHSSYACGHNLCDMCSSLIKYGGHCFIGVIHQL